MKRQKLTFFLGGNSDCVENDDLARILGQYPYDIQTGANFIIGAISGTSEQYTEWDYEVYYHHGSCNITTRKSKYDKYICIDSDESYLIIEAYLRKLIEKAAK